jgi:hypothetical protein
MNWSSKAFYDNELVAHSSVADRLLKDLPGVKSDENTGNNYILSFASCTSLAKFLGGWVGVKENF